MGLCWKAIHCCTEPVVLYIPVNIGFSKSGIFLREPFGLVRWGGYGGCLECLWGLFGAMCGGRGFSGKNDKPGAVQEIALKTEITRQKREC